MPTDWKRLSRDAGLPVEESSLAVALGEGRRHKVSVEESVASGLLRLWSIAAPPSAVAKVDEQPHIVAWARNRASDLVGFKIDSRGRLIGEAWVPVDGIDAHEWAIYVLAVARACDRIEYLLTGRDDE